MIQYLLFSSFPEDWSFNLGDSIDNFVKELSRNHKELFDTIRFAGIWLVTQIQNFLLAMPWWLVILLVAIAGYLASKKIRTGLLYGAMITLIGMFGLWTHMMETLSIVITSVVICFVLGFPLGILVALNPKLSNVLRPILDFMQTMPAFVYLIPAVMLFRVGVMPALMATTIYGIVPMIRMTSHGITHVDKEVIDASRSFGATIMQTLFKVQIPQALPTIMTGINQTIMMAMSMVVTCSLIGANGLGMEILVATNRTEIGRGLLPGLSIVFIAIIMDRLTQGFLQRGEFDEQK